MKRRRRRDVLRVQLVRIFELLADAGVISQMWVKFTSFMYSMTELHVELCTTSPWLLPSSYLILFFQCQWRIRWGKPLSEQHIAWVCGSDQAVARGWKWQGLWHSERHPLSLQCTCGQYYSDSSRYSCHILLLYVLIKGIVFCIIKLCFINYAI